MKTVWNERPSVTRCGSFCQNMTELINEGLSINIILKNISTLNSPAYDMMQGSRGIYAGSAGYNFRMSQMQKREKPNFMTVPSS
ncbi:MAG: hypothetical protein ACETWD_08935 [Desulfatiglandales bacterium]